MSVWSSRDDALTAWEVDYQPNHWLDIDLATAKSWNECLRIALMGDGPDSTDAAFMLTVDQANALAAALWMWAAEQEGTAK